MTQAKNSRFKEYEITPEDYKRNPKRFGTAEAAAHFPGFKHKDVETGGATIRLRHGGKGAPLLLIHGNPVTHFSWYKMAARLAEHYHVVLPDLRGYGDSSLPEPGDNHINFSFRAMAQDMVDVMEHLGFEEFFVAGLDRGGRTTHRLCMDHPERVKKVCIMDVLPNHYVWENVTKEWILRTWHWSFMAQPEPFPESLISAVPAEDFIKGRMSIRGGAGTGFLTDVAMREYVRCYTLKTITGSCRDYRATATCDCDMDRADYGNKIEMPLMLLWGGRSQSEERAKKFKSVWQEYAANIVRAEGLNTGHYIQEEDPDGLLERFIDFFRS